MDATAKNGDVWTGEVQEGYYEYRDKEGRLYESREAPAYRIVMDNAQLTRAGRRLVVAPIPRDYRHGK